MTAKQIPENQAPIAYETAPDFWPEVHMLVPTIDPKKLDPTDLGIASDKWEHLSLDQQTAVAAVIGVERFHQEQRNNMQGRVNR